MKKILFAEDDAGVQDVVSIILKNEFKVINCTNSEQLLRQPDAEALPDLYLIDRRLSSMDGLAVCRFLKSNDLTKDIPLIMVSASPDIVAQAKSAGADDVIPKPFEMKQLRATISKYVG